MAYLHTPVAYSNLKGRWGLFRWEDKLAPETVWGTLEWKISYRVRNQTPKPIL
jgi:hypothetical protein